jgi:hypothetical protein
MNGDDEILPVRDTSGCTLRSLWKTETIAATGILRDLVLVLVPNPANTKVFTSVTLRLWINLDLILFI